MPGDHGIALRVLDPREMVRPEEFVNPRALYLTGQEYAAMVVLQDPTLQKDTFSELAWLYPEEVRLLAALALAIPEGCGAIRFDKGSSPLLALEEGVKSFVDSPASSHGRESGKLYFIGGKTCEGTVLTKTINSQQKI
ncbi:MAG: hypothetical protein HYV04_17295 [Deltaproteobacteria bacterium]|nr:hypothetical protein [Deltaproteobacteria bacterium]